MSEIDTYKHECIGMVHCPSSYWPPPWWWAIEEAAGAFA